VNELQQFAALRTWLISITGLATIIRANPNAPRPAKPYGMLNLIRAERINWPDDIEYADIPTPGDGAPARQIPVEEWEWTWSFHVYGNEGTGYAARITSASKSDAALLTLHPLTLNRTSGIRRIPELLNETTWEDRIQVDLFVRGIVRHGFDLDIIEQASVDYVEADDTIIGTATASIIPPPPPAPEDPISDDPEP
jgi:hypothetical protein